MIERDRLMDSLCACRKEKGYACDTHCLFYNNPDCIEVLLENVHEYIGILEEAKKERDQLSDALLKLETADLTEKVYQDLKDAEEERDKLREENQNLLKKVPVWKRVEDEKPPYNTQVKLWTKEGFEYIGVYTYSKEFISDGFIELTKKVTHWMHLDEAPTAGASPRPTETREDEENEGA